MRVVRVAGALLMLLMAACGERHPALRRCVDETGAAADDGNCGMPAKAGALHHYTWVYTPAKE